MGRRGDNRKNFAFSKPINGMIEIPIAFTKTRVI
jgi:hypothetical protein